MARTNRTWTSKIGILQFARAYLGLRLYPWQRKILLAIEAGYPVAALVCNNGGEKTGGIPSPVLLVFFNFAAGRWEGFPGCWMKGREKAYPGSKNFGSRPALQWGGLQATEP